MDIDGEQLARVRLRIRVQERVTYSAQGLGSAPPIAGEIPEALVIPAPPPSEVATSEVAPAAVGTNEIVEPTPEPTEPVLENPEQAF